MANWLYTGRVSHSRFRPSLHRFRYGISMAMVDVASFAGTGLTLPLPAFLSFLLPIRRRDHLKSLSIAQGHTVPEALKTLVLERSGLVLDDQGSIHLLTGFGFLWHRFNPVSFYFCRDRHGLVQCLVAEVTNTPWKEQSLYVLDASGQQGGELWFSCAKDFHVSPFMPMDTHYHWHIRQRATRLLINIAVEHEGEPLFNAALDLSEKPLTVGNILAALARQPLMSLSVAWRIYWQALRLWLKATPLFSHPRYSSGDKQ